MNKKDQHNHRPSMNQQISSDNLIPQNETFTELIKQSNIKERYPPEQQNMSTTIIQAKSIENNIENFGQYRVNPPIQLQSRNVFVRSSSRKNNLQKQKEQNNNSIMVMNRKNTVVEKYEFNQPYLRPKTMVDIQKKYEMSSQTAKHKLPQAILQYIISKAKLKNQSLKTYAMTETGKKLSKLGLSKKLSQKYHTKKCNICQVQLPERQFQRMTKQCSHEFCSSCIHQYVIYKINGFQAVQCPNQECRYPLDQQSKLYKELPLEVRKKYKKLLQYEMVKEYPNRKMCPQQNCQGYIEINESIDAICSVCKKQYCPKCLLGYHEGDCDNKQLEFFQGTLHYRQCNRCKNIVQKSSGCIHMTCRCRYQFCYLCGGRWSHSHTCKNPEQQPLARERVQCCCCQVEACECSEECIEQCCNNCCLDCCDRLDAYCGCCFNEDGCCCQCACCQNAECPWFEAIFVVVLKFLIILGFICLVFPIFLLYAVIMGSLWLFVTLFIGATMYTLEYMSQLECCWLCVSIIFCPITMLIGIALAFRQVFCESYVPNVAEVAEDICQAFTQVICGDN